MVSPDETRYVICIRNEGYRVSLEIHKVYEVLPDPGAEASHFVRVVDESGEDYLYPATFFVPLELSDSVRDALRSTA